MRVIAAILFLIAVLGAPSPSFADLNSVSAREVARNNNCTPKKVDVYKQTLGSEGVTTYRIECTMAKTVNESAGKTADALLVNCRDNMCSLVRPLTADAK